MNTLDKSGKQLDCEWRAWLSQNLNRKCDPVDLLQILLKNGFDADSIRENMGGEYPLPSFVTPDYAAIAKVRLTRSPLAKRVLSNKVQLFTIDDFMNGTECDQIIEISKPVLRPSSVTTGKANYRTSSTSDLTLLNHPDVEALDEKISQTLGMSRSYSEGIQAQRYEVGQEFRRHTDYFQPGTEEYAEYAGRAGQRTWTFMVYLNDGMTGGGTRFFCLDKEFTPKKGMAVIWNNLFADGTPNPSTLHAGLPIESGCKVIITKWFRDRGTGPMFC